MRLGPSTKFFFYGTLLDADIRKRVVGRAVDDAVPATIAGHRRVRVAGKWFPMLVPGRAADTVEGIIATGLSRAEIDRLIAYEGDGYGLEPVTLRLADGRPVRGVVFRPRTAALKPSNEAWDLATFQREEKPRVLRGPLL